MTFPADSARFTEILEATLRDLVRTGERLSNCLLYTSDAADEL